DHRGVDRRVSVEGELLQPFWAGKAGFPDPPHGATPVAVVTFGHDQLGQKPEVGQLLAFRGGSDLGESVTHGGQPQHPASLFDRRDGGLLGDPTSAAGHELSRRSNWSYWCTVGSGRSSPGKATRRRSVRLTTRLCPGDAWAISLCWPRRSAAL